MLSFAPMKKELLFTKQALKFLNELPADVRAEFAADFAELERNGRLEMPAGRKLNRGLFEVRVSMDGNAYRTMYCYSTGAEIWMLCGFQKKTQETPTQEIRKALKIKRSIGL